MLQVAQMGGTSQGALGRCSTTRTSRSAAGVVVELRSSSGGGIVHAIPGMDVVRGGARVALFSSDLGRGGYNVN